MKLLRTTIAGLFAAVVAAAGAAADPGLTTGSGCAAQCIRKALVTGTASSAKIEIETSVPTRLRVSIAKAGAAAAYSSLAPGSHSFAVRATDAAGNVGPAASRGWTVFEPLPDLAVAALSKFSVVVVNRGSATAGPSVLTITFVGTFTVPSLAPGGTATFNWSICRAGTYTAVVDRTNAVRESNESNNTAARVNTCP